ncbi:uncharacterized protein LOC108480303 [Gossypium arboreum]|uniref:uncharacterized protein LOC108480303 n=1 Tax=Gossypium arboreum TaxID=29729 RepID=UPI0022F1BE0C|nr:uncharacterized protein LOC108480303 [Gossypium arboreum]
MPITASFNPSSIPTKHAEWHSAPYPQNSHSSRLSFNFTLLASSDRLQMGEVVSTIPTIGFNVETVQYNNIKLQVWDLGGQTSMRPYWRCYFPNTQAIIYVVDSSDTDRVGIAKEELYAILEGVTQAIIRSVIDFKRDPWPKVLDTAKDLVKKMLNPDPKQHLTV